MRIALDARCTRQMSVGMQRYAREMAARLPDIAREHEFTTLREGENFGVAEQVRLPLAVRRAKAELVHHLSLYAPLIKVAPTVVTIHDLIHMQYPEYFKPHVQPYYHLVVRALLAQARLVITDDARTIDELHGRLGVHPRKIRVIALGVDDALLDLPDREQDRFSEIRPYLLYAGNHRPHKNLSTAIEAWARLPDHVRFDFVMTGDDDFPAELPRSRPNGAQLFCVGNLSAEKLVTVMQSAAALVYPSLSEGFGLPMLEALALGTAVIASDQAVPGILHAHCDVVPATDVAAWTWAMAAVQPSASADRLRRRAVAREYTWDRCARETAACYRELQQEA